jgi:bifunctional non-homologous end joining protein LigD
MKRYPDGIGAQHFYEKDAPSFTPDWVKTFAVPRRTGGKDIRYVLINDLPTLVWSANLANLEIHPFLHRAPRIDRPTLLVFDLDPGEGTNVLRCAEVAFHLRDVLTRSGLLCFPKVSGSKGMQVSVPLNRRASYEDTQAFARAVAQLLEREHAGFIVSEMSKELRKGKVFIDWSQNSDFKTTVGVYSLRAKRSHPFVSMPVTWEELRRALDRSDPERLYFSPEAAWKRLQKTGDLYEPLLTLKQTLPDPKALQDSPKQTARIAFVEPMRAKLAEDLPAGDEWVYEIKLDGYRALALKTAGEAELRSRNNNLLNARFPGIVKALERLPTDTILDGEIVALDEDGRPRFNALQNAPSASPQIYYYVFDLLASGGRSLLREPLSRRRALLDETLAPLSDPVRLSGLLEASPRDLLAAARQQGLEGLVAKRRASIYEPGQRSGAWVKVKVNQGQEMVVGGYIPGKTHFDSLLVGYYEGKRLIFNAKVRNGFVPRLREAVYERMKPLETGVCPFDNLPEPRGARRGEALTAEVMKKCRWLKPKLVAQVEYTEWTEGDHLRHSRFAGLREDKDARQVRRDLPE